MKLRKCLFVFAMALFAIPGVCSAQNLQFLGGGTSSLFVELGQAAATLIGPGACIWTNTAGAASASDNRTINGDTESGQVWVVWDKGTAGTDCGHPSNDFNVYSYMSVDSVFANLCYFEADSNVSGCIAKYIPRPIFAQSGANLLAPFNDSPPFVCGITFPGSLCVIPPVVYQFLSGKRWFVSGTDIRPEDAKFATFRALTPCTTTIFRSPFGESLTTINGLGYNVGGPQAGIGKSIGDYYSSSFGSYPVDFNISGNDSFTLQPVRGYTVNTVGAQPIVVSVSPAGDTGLGAATDINLFTLTLFYNGVLGRATDLLGPTTNPSFLTALVDEPLSGVFNTLEYSVLNTNEFHTSQEFGNCNTSTGAPATNPMNLQSGNGVTQAARRRVFGTDQMVKQLQQTPAGENRMGYWFWSASNGANFTTANGKYLTVNGVDPLADSYSVTNGVIPTGSNLSQVTFKALNAGDYPIWSALRLVTTNPAPAAVTNLIAAAQTLNSTNNDFVPLSKLNVWHSHFALPQINVGAAANGPTINAPGDLCNSTVLAEFGGDAGGANVLKVANLDFCADFSTTTGLINASN